MNILKNFDKILFGFEDNPPPEQYPDWDGDESMLWYLYNCIEDEENENDLEDTDY
jgi:hypothetical protein